MINNKNKRKIMKMKPIGDQVLLKPEKREETTKSGIILTSSITNYGQALVMEVGTGLYTQTGDKIPMTVSKGDTVVLRAGLLKGDKEIEVDGEKYILVRESEISGIWKN
tara:strand:- start:523 stop:849 length:327 start_codon:yes stop_codon:yes gene_type:complete